MDTIQLQVSSTLYLKALFDIFYSMEKSLSISMLHSCSNHWICIGVDVGMGMAWVFDSIDSNPTTYKDFVSILKTYTYRHSSSP
jgi:hypothetical protein